METGVNVVSSNAIVHVRPLLFVHYGGLIATEPWQVGGRFLRAGVKSVIRTKM